MDFDGVVHPRVGGRGFTDTCVTALREALHPFEVEIVVSSSWRLTCHQTELEGLLQGLGKSVVGSTPELERGLDKKRYFEILAYLSDKDIYIEWVAIDDSSHFFPADAPVYLTDPKTGFTKGDIVGLQGLIKSVCQ